MLYLLFTGCLMEPSATLSGRIIDTSLNGAPDAKITIRDATGSIFSETEANGEGEFKVNLPPLNIFFLEAEGANSPPTAFTGFAGEGDTVAPENTLILRNQSEIDTIMANYDGCNESTLGMIDGRVAVDIPGQDTTSLPSVTTATTKAIDDAGNIYGGCYQADSDGSESEETGESGRYAIMGLPQGIITLRVTVQYDSEISEDYDHMLYVPMNGATALDPTLIPL